MGFWSGLRDGWKGASTARQAEAKAMGEAISGKLERAGNKVGGFRPVAGTLNAGRKAVKFGAIGAALVAGAAAVGIMANRSRKAAAGAAQDDIANAPNTVDVPEAVIPQMIPPQAQDVGPAEGRKEGEWVGRVAADRGGLAPQNPAAQPKMSVVPDSAVQDLGSATPAQPTR